MIVTEDMTPLQMFLDTDIYGNYYSIPEALRKEWRFLRDPESEVEQGLLEEVFSKYRFHSVNKPLEAA